MYTPPDRLATEFPTVTPSPQCGWWWRIHWAKHGAWWFASGDGWFDLRQPFGTCYVGEHLAGPASEHMRATTTNHARAQRDANERRLSAMPLEPWHNTRIADFTSELAADFNAPRHIECLDHDEARPWAEAAHAGGFAGVLYHLRRDPRKRRGLALFSEAGENPPGNVQQASFPPSRLAY
jgi:hypothetical protein